MRADASRAVARRLLWVNHFAVTPDMGGGTRHFELSRELVRMGWDVTIAASDFHLHRRSYCRRRDARERGTVRETLDGVAIEWLWAAPYTRNDARRVRNWLSFGWSLARRRPSAAAPGVVIGSTPHLFAALAAYRVARRLGVPFVLEVRDLWPESLDVSGRRRGAGYLALSSLARFLYHAADRVIVLAHGAGEYIADMGVPRERIALVPNGADVSAFGAAPPPRDTLRLVYAGAHGPANGLDAVLEAADQLRGEPHVSFVLVGDGSDKPALRERARRLGLANVTFLDPVSKSDMPALLAGCDAGLMVLKELPLFSFGVSPNKLFDYWGASLPVVCNVPGEVASLVEAAAGGVQAADGSGLALADAVRRLLALAPASRRALGASGHGWVRRERDRPVLAARLDAMLRAIPPGRS